MTTLYATDLSLYKQQLNTAAQDGSLTAAMLAEAIRTTGDGGSDTIPYSVGVRWIQQNPQAAREVIDNVEDFFRGLFDCPAAAWVIYEPELMQQIAENRLPAFVIDLMRAQRPRNTEWVEALRKLGYDDNALGEVLLAILEATDVTNPYGDYFGHNFIADDFLNRGAGDVIYSDGRGSLFVERFGYRNPLWDVLDDEQFRQAVDICIGKFPLLLFLHGFRQDFSIRELLGMRLNAATLNQLAIEAAGRIESFKELSVPELLKLPPEIRINLLAKPDAPFRLLVETALELPAPQGINLCQMLIGLLQATDPAYAYRSTWKLLEQSTSTDVAFWLQTKLQDMLKAKGILLAQVKVGYHRNQRQLEVTDTVTRRKYINQRFGAEFHPSEGDWVLVDTNAARQLGQSRVYVANFRSAHPTN